MTTGIVLQHLASTLLGFVHVQAEVSEQTACVCLHQPWQLNN